MTKGNGALNETIELNQEGPASKDVVLNLMQFVQDVAQALDLLTEHMEFHCHQIAALQKEVEALKSGLSESAETVSVGEIYAPKIND